jgi:hypothetical protein
MSISGKVKLALGALLAMMILHAGVGLYLDYNVQSRVQTAIKKNFAAADALSEVSVLGHQMRRFEKEYFIYVTETAGREKYRKEWTAAQSRLQRALDTMRANADGLYVTTDLESFTRWNTALQYYTSEFRVIMERAEAGQLQPVFATGTGNDADGRATGNAGKGGPNSGVVPQPNLADPTRIANLAIGPGKDRFRELLNGADTLRREKLQQSTVAAVEVQQLFRRSNYASMMLLALGMMVGLYQMLSIPRTIRRPIDEFVGLAVRISKGDVSQGNQGPQFEEFQPLAHALERLRVAQIGLLERARNRAKP